MCADVSRYGRPRISAEFENVIMAKAVGSPRKSTRRISLELDIYRTTIQRLLKMFRFHLYKFQVLHHMAEDDPDCRVKKCCWIF